MVQTVTGPGCLTRYVNAYTPNETHWLSNGKYAQSGVTCRALLECHGRGLYADQYFGNGVIRPASVVGFPTVVADCGGSGTDTTHGTGGWGSDLTVSSIDAQITWVTALPHVLTGKVLLIGESMGTLAVLNYLARNPSKVQAVVCLLPALSLQDLHDNKAGPTDVTNIENAYGGSAGYTAALPTNDPNQQRATIAATGVPILFCYSATDTLADPTISSSFATAVGATTYAIPGASGHDSSTLDPLVYLSWLAQHA